MFRILLSRAVRSVLTGRPRSRIHPSRGEFTADDLDHLLDVVWRFERSIPAHPGADDDQRSRVTQRYAAFSLALLDALLLREVERDYAIDLIADVAARVAHWSPLAVCPTGPADATCPAAEFLRAHDAPELVCAGCWQHY